MASSTEQTFSLPDMLPIFPLRGVLLLPRGQLPLNIFEPRYLNMVEDALRTNRMIGIVQPNGENTTSLYQAGCVGRITSFEETSDGRYLIVLNGISRFEIEEELSAIRGYRTVQPNWTKYEKDTHCESCLDVDREKLCDLLKSYFDLNGLTCSWEAIMNAGDDTLITSLAMVCPFDPPEKQALLEAECCKARAKLFTTLLEIAIYDTDPQEFPIKVKH